MARNAPSPDEMDEESTAPQLLEDELELDGDESSGPGGLGKGSFPLMLVEWEKRTNEGETNSRGKAKEPDVEFTLAVLNANDENQLPKTQKVWIGLGSSSRWKLTEFAKAFGFFIGEKIKLNADVVGNKAIGTTKDGKGKYKNVYRLEEFRSMNEDEAKEYADEPE